MSFFFLSVFLFYFFAFWRVCLVFGCGGGRLDGVDGGDVDVCAD